MKDIRIHTSLLGILGCSAVLWTTPAISQDVAEEQETSRRQIEEITVTAERRETSLQETPIAISAFSENDIERSDLDSLQNIQTQVPGLVYAETQSYAQVTIRGVGLELPFASGEPGVALNVDGVYLPRSATSSAMQSDLERIEVLRGPQGTLYGRNSTGGTVNFWTKTPNGETEGDLSLLAGDENRLRVRGGVSFPIIGETLSARVSFATEEHDGYRTNLFTGDQTDGIDHKSIRAVVRWVPSDDLEMLFRYSYSRDDNGGPSFSYGTEVLPANSPASYGGTLPLSSTEFYNDFPADAQRRNEMSSLTINYDLPLFGGSTLKSITAYQTFEWEFEGDLDGTDIPYVEARDMEEADSWTQEITLSGATEKLQWVIGGFYFTDRADSSFYRNYRVPESYGPNFPEIGFFYEQDIDAWAVFTQGTYSLTDRLRLTLGARYTNEKKDFTNNLYFHTAAVHVPALPTFDSLFGARQEIPTTGPFAGQYPAEPGGVLYNGGGIDNNQAGFTCLNLRHDGEWNDTTAKVGLDFDVADDFLFYASVSTGFKAGGGNVGGCGDQFDPEDILAYEMGFKSEWFDNRLQVNLAGFYYDYQDYQAVIYLANIGGETRNASDAEVYGAELEFVAVPFEGLQIRGGGSLQSAEFGDFLTDDALCDPAVANCVDLNLKGNHLPRSPEKSFFVNAEYQRPVGDWGTMALRYEYSWTDEYYFTPFNRDFVKQDSYSISNVRLILGTAGGRFEGSLGDSELHFFVNNLTDEDELLGGVIEVAGVGGTWNQWLDPRTYGVELRVRF